MNKKNLNDLNLLDNFLFSTMVMHPAAGERFVRCILETVFQRNFGPLTIVSQKAYPGANTDKHGARLDVYVEETRTNLEDDPNFGDGSDQESDPNSGGRSGHRDGSGFEDVLSYNDNSGHGFDHKDGSGCNNDTGAGKISEEAHTDGSIPGKVIVYDIEPDRIRGGKASLPRRTRFYHSKIDTFSLRSGEGYSSLKNVYVIMIMDYDPFGMDHMVYTVRRRCEELPFMPYDDGAVTLFFYTKGKKGDLPDPLREMLYYFDHTEQKNAVNQTLLDIQKMVDIVKQDGDVAMEYMRTREYDEELIRQGRQQGRLAERANTERERRRAEAAEKERNAAASRAKIAEKERNAATSRAETAEKELARLRRELALLRGNI